MRWALNTWLILAFLPLAALFVLALGVQAACEFAEGDDYGRA